MTNTETAAEPFTLPGEGERKIVERVRVREECEQCGEPATKKHTYLLYNARSNPASSGYGKDDISWCSDIEAFACDDCREPSAPDGHKWCATFTVSPATTRFSHMFLRWTEREVEQVSA